MSFSDMFKKNNDLGGSKAFTTDTSFKIKSKTAEGVVTSPDHNFVNGDVVVIDGVKGMTELNGNECVVVLNCISC